MRDQLDPIKKQLQGQLSSFQKDIQRMQNEQKDMMKSYKKEVDQIQQKKDTIIHDMKYEHQSELKKQIDQLQKTIQ